MLTRKDIALETGATNSFPAVSLADLKNRDSSGLAATDFLAMLRHLVSSIPVEPSLEAFAELAGRGNVVPVYTLFAADFETPLSAYLKLRDNCHSFLLESAESTEKGGRWSLVGSGPRLVFEAHGKEITIRNGSKTRTFTAEDDVLAAIIFQTNRLSINVQDV